MAADKRSFGAPKGTRDVLPPEAREWQAVTRLALDIFGRAGYQVMETPIFEHTEVFERGVGAASEVVGKQMYTFEDRAGRSLTLRPEGTAPVVRAVLEHGLVRGALPVKLCYVGPMFRQERPQKGRFRQFAQLGIEALGSDDPMVDAEVIEVGKRFLSAAGIESRLLLNSIGHHDPACRGGYLETLRSFLREHREALAEEDQARVDTNPLRMFDSKERATMGVMREAPLVTDHLCDACRKHFEAVQGLLTDISIDFEIEPRLVRGLDYYTRTAFEYISEGLGAQNAVGGGGRYDGLAESLGGEPLPSIGFALGLDRIMIARTAEPTPAAIDVYVVAAGEEATRAAFKLVAQLRSDGLGADLDLAGRSMKGQMKQAAASGARWAAIIGERELTAGTVTLKDLGTSDQQEVAQGSVAEVVRR